MQIGLFAYNMAPLIDPPLAVETAQQLESLGYDSIWVGEHMVVPSPRVPPSPMEPGEAILDPLISLAFAAGVTSRLLLGTGVLLLPQRHPVQLAKELASLDVLSNGRLRVGVGIGYLEPEMAAVGVPMARRDARAMEHLAAMRALWSMDKPAFNGEFVSFAAVDAHPRPTSASGPPVVMGGHVPAAYRRAVQHADGWYGFMLTPERAAESVAGVRRAAERYGRDLAGFEISVTPAVHLDAAVVRDYAAAGVDRLIVYPRTTRVDSLRRIIDTNAPRALGLEDGSDPSYSA